VPRQLTPAATLLALIASAALAFAGAPATRPPDIQPHAMMLRYPAVSADAICFSYANDLWLVPRTGGVAMPLASPPGQETFPHFSPDGKTIAFVGNYDGNRDIYTMPLDGGIPTRVTHHPAAESLCGWTSDGKLLFLSNGFVGLPRQSQLFTVAPTGGMPQRVPVPYAGFGSISDDGKWLAYTLHSTDTRTWKRYRGGMATDVWLFNLADHTSKKITDWEGTDTLPMWHGTNVYYLSDDVPTTPAGAAHRLNIWSYDTKTSKRERITAFGDDDVKWPSMGPGKNGQGEIVFQLGARIHLLDLATKQTTAVDVTIPGAHPTIRPRTVDESKQITGADISPSGKRVVLAARGDLWTAPAKEGFVRALTRTDGVAERDPAWSPDGKWIAYFCDAAPDNEYDLWVRSADGKSDPAPRKLTNLGPGFRYNPVWSPDSKLIAFTDKAGGLFLCTVESGQVKQIDTDPVANQVDCSWSQDSGWLAYARADEGNEQGAIWLYNAKTGDKTRLTSSFFGCGSPTFDRKGDFLYFSSNRTFQAPIYADLDQSWVYTGTDTLLMVPLRADVKNPFLPKNDDENDKKDADEKKDGEKKDGDKKDDKDKKDGSDKPADKGDKHDEKKNDKPKDDAQADDGISGTWEGRATGGGGDFPPGGLPFTLHLKRGGDGALSGTLTSGMGNGPVTGGTFDIASGALSLTIQIGDAAATLVGTVKAGEVSGTWQHGEGKGDWTAKRTASDGGGGGGGGDKDEEKKEAKKEKPKDVLIDLEGFESRAMPLPIPAGNFGRLAVSDDNKLIYVRHAARGAGGEPGIKIFDPKDDTHEEKTVTSGAGGFDISADGKKLLVRKGGGFTVMEASAGGGKSTTVPTAGMTATIDPRAEWRQIFTDTWRIERDFFYEPTMHGVNWPAMRDHYGKMVEDCVTREDLAYVQGEMISELNIGHAYVTSPGDVEQQPTIPVGMLGCDYTLEQTDLGKAYQIATIYTGAPWDSDARGPLSQPGVDVHTGDYLLAVNGQPIDTAQDPWAAFQGAADRPTLITVSKKPTLDAEARDVVVKPVPSEATLRYRAWIEHNRKYVEDKSGGQVGYIYVPSTGLDGQTDLYRQFLGQRDKAALIIDERWNSGGQIPTRFIELLNRPVTNYWAKRDGKDGTWPPDSHQGPKCMLINGLAGSGGDMFPWLFHHDKLGALIGMRTWGGLVGISGNPGLVDGGAISAPTFGFYKTNGTWGVEGHGVDPDIEVVDDPAKMWNGGDPQLDTALDLMAHEIKEHGYTPPKRPASPDRSGMGSRPEDR
jgi:tricorn protease-like protein/C-terminal processing protease CtpA/Prc